jgi:CcmD family protein
MRNKLTYIYITLFTFLSNIAVSQSNKSGIEQTFHESGKINVVVAVLVVIFVGIVYYLIKMNHKISKLEKELGNK